MLENREMIKKHKTVFIKICNKHNEFSFQNMLQLGMLKCYFFSKIYLVLDWN